MSERIERLQVAVEAACGCVATHAESHPVAETFRGEILWEGVVEAFDLRGHQKAARCYAFHVMEDEGPQFTTVLEIPPVDSPVTAVRMALAAKGKK